MDKSLMKENYMVTKNPGAVLFVFALPMIIGNLFQQFYNMVDTIIVGRFIGTQALAAVGASYAFTNVFIMIAIGGGIGASVLTSQYLGAEEYGKMRTSVFTALISFLLISVCLALLGFVLNPLLMRLLRTPQDVFSDAVLYLQIYFAGIPFLFMYNVITATFNALGKSYIPLVFLFCSSVLNIILDIWMVVQCRLGVAGAAIATVIAQGLSAVLSFLVLLLILRGYSVSEGEKVKLFDWKMFFSGMKIAIPSIIQQSIVSIGMLLVQSVVNFFGTEAIAGYSAGTRVESICIVPMIAMGNAVSTFTAQNLGAKKPERVKQGLCSSFFIVIGFAVVICAALGIYHDSIMRMFINEHVSGNAFATGNAYLMFIAWFFVFIGFKATTDGVLRGSGDVTVYMVANLVNLGIRVTIANLCAPVFGIQAVWYATPVGWIVNFLMSYSWYKTGRWSRMGLVEEQVLAEEKKS